MKKFIKIFGLIIFILLIFGRTTSQAGLTVTSSTTASAMVAELNKDRGYLTGVSNKVRKSNPYMYCRQHGKHISGKAEYGLDQVAKFPDDDSMYGHAKAYILAADGYGDNTSDGLRQIAWWQIIGQEPGENALLKIAKAYQTYKESEETVIVNNSNATTQISDNEVVYGPIRITYSYANSSADSYSDEWGGFDYAFFSGDTIVSSGVTLCTMSDEDYITITSTQSSNNYYKVRMADYNEINLYAVIDLSTVGNINKINLKIKENVVDYQAEIYEIAGTYTSQIAYRAYCITCEDIIETKKTTVSTSLTEGDIVEYKEEYYQYMGYTTEKKIFSEPQSDIYNYYKYGDEYVEIDQASYTIGVGVFTNDGLGILNPSGGDWTPKSAAEYVQENEGCFYVINYTYTSYIYNFEIFKGCGVDEDTIVSNLTSVSTNLNEGDFVEYNEEYYKYTGYTVQTKSYSERQLDIYNYYKYGDEYVAIDKVLPIQVVYVFTDEHLGIMSSNSEGWTIASAESYVKTYGGYYVVSYKYTSYIYNFELLSTDCGSMNEANVVYDSQRLFVVKTANKVTSNEVKLDIEIELTTTIEVVKNWDDYQNQYGTRPETIELTVQRKTSNSEWETITDYTISEWSIDENTWTATISGLKSTDDSGNVYYYKVLEKTTPNHYVVTYSSSDNSESYTNGRVANVTNKITITNTLPTVDIEVTKVWDDNNNYHQLRPEDITLTVKRAVNDTGKTSFYFNELTWESLEEGKDYDEIVWTKNDNTWTATISNLLEINEDGKKYYFQVIEEAVDYYRVTYSSAKAEGYASDNYIRTAVEDKTITITNTQPTVDIEVTKVWDDHNNYYQLRPEDITLTVKRAVNDTGKTSFYFNELTWESLEEGKDYDEIVWTKNDNTWTATISNLLEINEDGKKYYFQVIEEAVDYYRVTYSSAKAEGYASDNYIRTAVEDKTITITNALENIDISGYVWLDGQTGIKPAVPNNGTMEDTETRMENIVVYLYYRNPETEEVSKVAETVTDSNGYYNFENYEIGYYYVEFEYDGVHYEDTISVENGSSKAFELDENRDTFNERFQTITYGQSNDGTILSYNYANNKSTLITTGENGKVKQEFIMNATTQEELYITDTSNINLGLVKRGTDIALSTDVSNAEVNINGQKTNYTYNSTENTIEISNGQTNEEVSYNLNLYTSDYNYRIRNYVSNDTFKENDYINEEELEGVTTGEELNVYVTYELNLQNQSTETTKINEVKYTFDEKYTFKHIIDSSYDTAVSGNTITINLNGLSLEEGETETLYLLFEVNNNDGLSTGNFFNKAEITSYSTDNGLIDVDSQPGNFVNDNQVEDDNDTAGGLTIETEDTFVRKITGKVFDEENQNVNDVIVQLIELKTVSGKVYEYIWQETVSGAGKGLRLNAEGTALEEYTYTQTNGSYEFIGFIPGDYIVRFIYGDGTTYDMTGNVIKYNGQDYKSTEDSNYNVEWYNSSSYTEGASVARDNEARRLETMAYSVEIDAQKGVLLKLLNNITVEDLNETEKEVIVSTYNNLYDPDITEVTTEVINKLLKEQVLKNTWMCAETSKIKVAVDTENITNTNAVTTVNGTNGVYVEEIPNINLGLELRPATKIELEKYITGFKLTAANGQTLVNAYVDVSEYLNNPTDISNKVQGIRDNVTILDTVWQYEVAPTDINTIVDGASLEFEYTLVVKNTGDTDYLSTELANSYANNTTADYIALLTSKANEIKGYMKADTYRTQIGNAVGNSYYVGGTGTGKVLTEITNIRDYVNNDLTLKTSVGDVEVDEDAPHTYRILRDDYSMQEATINTILKTTRPTGKMENDGTAGIYTVTLGKNPISSTGNLNFENYIAEVMSYTNAAGRRAMTSTPGNAEIIDHEYRDGKTHEIDEADTARIQIGAATGEDGKTNYIIIIAVIAGIVIVAAGAVVVKKYVIK